MAHSMLVKPRLLIMAIGNVARGDDGAAPRLLDQLQAYIEQDNATRKVDYICEDVFQLQPEHIYDMQQVDWVWFLDAAINQQEHYQIQRLRANATPVVGAHSVSVDNLIGWYERLLQHTAPPCLLITLRAHEFEFCETLSVGTQYAISACLAFLRGFLADPPALFTYTENAPPCTSGL
jgi:hydrogenase maturation protease